MARLAVTADLHHDVPRSRSAAEGLARELGEADVDAVLLCGDTATAESDRLEEALAMFRPDRLRLFVPGNHELWSRDRLRSAEHLMTRELPDRVEAAGWHWLPGQPVRLGGAVIVGSSGWYDFSFAEPRLGLPRRFYEAGLSPGAARKLGREDLRPVSADVPGFAARFYARWNDARFIQGIADHPEFLARRLEELEADIDAAATLAGRIVVGTHVCPVAELLPRVPPLGTIPPEKLKYAFARAFLGSGEIGRRVLRHPAVTHLVCGHSHSPRSHDAGGTRCINVGSTYTQKRWIAIDV